LHQGLPADYAFFHARRKAVIYEALCHLKGEELARTKIAAIFEEDDSLGKPMNSIVADAGQSWEEIMRAAPGALSLTLLAGVGERLL
jgi:hypothetical protein